MIIGSVLTLGLFINHFMIIRNKTKTMWRIKINQIIIVMLIIVHMWRVMANIIELFKLNQS